MALAKGGQTAIAIASFKEALKLNPNHAKAHYDLALALNSSGQTEEAITHYQKALEVKSDYIEAMNNLSAIFFREGRLDDAIQWLRRALETKPDYQSAQRNITLVEAEREKLLKALASRRETIRTKPDDASLLNDAAWILATNPNASVRNGAEAVELARRAAQLTDSKEPMILGTLAAAYAEAGRFPEAVETAQQAQSIASQQKLPALADLLQSRIRLFQAKTAFREAPRQSD
jgi:tetratricopeptide (TPR) repeat protein